MSWLRNSIELLICGYIRRIEIKHTKPIDIIKLCIKYHDRAFHWSWNKINWSELNERTIDINKLKHSIHNKCNIKCILSNGKQGKIEKLARIYDEELIGIKLSDTCFPENSLQIGSYAKLGETTVKLMTFNVREGCYGTLTKSGVFFELVNPEVLNPVHDLIQYEPQNLIDLNSGDIIWRSIKDLQPINYLDDQDEKSLMYTHGIPMMIALINHNSFSFQLMILPFGDEFAKTFAILKLIRKPININNMTALFTLYHDKLVMLRTKKMTTFDKIGQCVEWHIRDRLSLISRLKYFRLSLDMKIFHIEYKDENDECMAKPIKMKSKLMKSYNLKQMCCDSPFPFDLYRDEYWSMTLTRRTIGGDAIMELNLSNLPFKVIEITVELKIESEVETPSIYKRDAKNYRPMVGMFPLSHLKLSCDNVKISLNVLRVLNHLQEEIKEEEWNRYYIGI